MIKIIITPNILLKKRKYRKLDLLICVLNFKFCVGEIKANFYINISNR